jgi:type VI secretion system protein ImpG
MDARLLDRYNTELQYLREMGAEFAPQNPRVAAQLGLSSDPDSCRDPHVERLLEGVAFLTARVQLKIDARYPQFTQALMEMVYPHLLTPFPACAIAELAPKFQDTALRAGKPFPRGSGLRTVLEKGDRTACVFRTAHDVTLWPITVAEVKYIPNAGALPGPREALARAAIRIKLRTQGGTKFNELPVNALDFYIKGSSTTAARIYEQVLADGLGLRVQGADSVVTLPASAIASCGYEDSQSLLPLANASPGTNDTDRGRTTAPTAFSGYRLMQEYFAFSDRFFFFTLRDVAPAIQGQNTSELDIYVLLKHSDATLDGAIDTSSLRLYCTPIVNLFRKTFDRVEVDPARTEYHVAVDRSRWADYEIFSIGQVKGIGGNATVVAEASPFYGNQHKQLADEGVYYTLQRRTRSQAAMQSKATAARSSEPGGTQCFISITDLRSKAQPDYSEIKQLEVAGWCMNRDMPQRAQSKLQLMADDAAFVDRVDCIAGPKAPQSSLAQGDTAWYMLSHLALNHLSLQDAAQGPELLRKILGLYANCHDREAARDLTRRVEGVDSISYKSCLERVPTPGPIAYGRGLEIELTLDDTAYEGTGILMLGEVLERFFARHVSINSFTRLRLRSLSRGVVKTWPVRLGTRAIL